MILCTVPPTTRSWTELWRFAPRTSIVAFSRVRDAEQFHLGVTADEPRRVRNAGLAKARCPLAVEESLELVHNGLSVDLERGKCPELGSRHDMDRDDLRAGLPCHSRSPLCRGVRTAGAVETDDDCAHDHDPIS